MMSLRGRLVFFGAVAAVLLAAPLFSFEAMAHGTKSAQRLESSLAKLSIRLGNIEAQLRTLRGQIEEAQHGSNLSKKTLSDKTEDIDQRVKRMDLNLRRVMRAVKAMASKTSKRGRVSSKPAPKNTRLALASANPDSLYNYALDQLFNKKNYPQAERAFESFVKKFPDHERAGSALYWLGESFYVRKRHREAASAYLRSFNSYGTSPKAAESLLKLGMTLAKLNEWDEACSTYDKLRTTFPSAPQHILQRLSTEYERVQCNAGFTG